MNVTNFDNIQVGDGTGNQKCLPHVSTYTDCTQDNLCDGCEQCTCSAEGKWVCQSVRECEGSPAEHDEEITENDLDAALEVLLYDMENQQETDTSKKTHSPLVPAPSKFDHLLDDEQKKIKSEETEKRSSDMDEEDTFLSFLYGRSKRSVKEKKAIKGTDNETVIFHHTIDEINEDTLKNANISGTLTATKFDVIPQASRRSNVLNNSTSEALQIEYTPPINNLHVGDNKVDTPAIHDDKEDLIVHHKIFQTIGNQSQATRDKDLSKIVVNELKGGEETIGDKSAPVISNITFTAENDTLTAMAFIAGNLLNKLWNMEKDESDNSLDTDTMKHKKVNDLLELFKEPLNLRQETFLKNALERLSSAIENKNIENISICHDIEELKKTSTLASKASRAKPLTESEYINSEEQNQSQKTVAADALSKISNVLDLIKKYEQVQNSLIDVKSKSDSEDNTDQNRKTLDKSLSKDEKSTLDVFGGILKSLTKILIPNKSGRKLLKAVNSRNLFSKDIDIREKLSNLNLSSLPITAKDRLVLDYLNHIRSSPSCLLNKQPKEKPTLPNVEGGILLNLSEFLRIKSMLDLLKLVDLKKNNEEMSVMRSANTKAQETLNSTTKNIFYHPETDYSTTEPNTQITEKNNKSQFEATKEKLKTHLKTILEDLLELQNISGNGKSTQGKGIEIAEALPCIYNLLNASKGSNTVNTNKEKPNKVAVDPVNKVTDIFNKLKKELKRTAQTRRSNVAVSPTGPRPKSAIVWKRTIKNLSRKQKHSSRRNLGEKTAKSLEDLKEILGKMEASESNTYKSIAYLGRVPVTERLLLLKTLATDIKRNIDALVDTKQAIETKTKLTTEQHRTIAEFIDNVNINVNLNGKIIKRLNETRLDKYMSNQENKPMKNLKLYTATKELETASSAADAIKLTRDQIINQLIKNRMLYYLRLKEASGESKGNINFDLATKVLFYLETGNDNLARQLFKLFVLQNKTKTGNTSGSQVSEAGRYEIINNKRPDRRLNYKVPLIQFEEPKTNKVVSMPNPDQLIKQLLNIKNMKV